MAGLGWIRYLGQRTQSPSPRPALVDDDLAGELRHSPSSSPKQLHPQDRVHLTSNILNLDVRTSSTRDLDGGVDAVPSPLPTGENTPAVSIKDSGGGTLDDKTATTYEHDRTWHAPSLDQIVEALKVAMMTKWDSLAPIPVQYNSHVLHLLEGYAKQQRCLADAAEKAADAQSRWDKEREEVRILAKMWSSREEDYRQEVRRLELLLAEASPDGTGAVILARAGSLVDRGARKEFQERLARLGDPQDRRDDSHQESSVESQAQNLALSRTRGSFRTIDSMPRSLDPDQDAKLSERLQTESRSSARGHHASHEHYRGTGPETMEEERTQRFGQRSGTNVQPEQSGRIFQTGQGVNYEMGIDSSSSSSSSSSDSCVSEVQPPGAGRYADEENGRLGCPSLEMYATRVYETPAHISTNASPDGLRTSIGGHTILDEVDSNIQGRDDEGEPGRQWSGLEDEDHFSQVQSQPDNRRVRCFSFDAGRDDVLSVTTPAPIPADETSSAE